MVSAGKRDDGTVPVGAVVLEGSYWTACGGLYGARLLSDGRSLDPPYLCGYLVWVAGAGWKEYQHHTLNNSSRAAATQEYTIWARGVERVSCMDGAESTHLSFEEAGALGLSLDLLGSGGDVWERGV